MNRRTSGSHPRIDPPDPAIPRSRDQGSGIRDKRLGIAAAVLFLVTAAAYQPAWHGEPLWDDDGHVTRVELRTASGLAQIWTQIGATQQYYPVTHSAFWIQQALWGDAPLGYHLVNTSLHALSACLLGLILLRLGVPGAWLAAAIFALHPVHVESVAWISELKNVLSGVLYLSAALVYLEFDRTRRLPWYLVAALLFGLAILAKSVTVTLPAALLVVFWWRRGHIDWRSDVRPLLPFFAVGLAAGLVTVWFERNLIGAQGEEFGLTAIERLLLAGRAAWFYAAALFWPLNLSFIYPRWHIDQSAPWQYAFPLAAAGALALAWRLRHLTRAPLAALLFFGGTVFPALGFFNVYPFRFSYVADHFQYLASIGLIVLVSASLAIAFRRRTPGTLVLAAAPLLLVLALLTWRQAHNYRDTETLYRATIAANPQAWLAHNNLAVVLLEGDPPEANVREAAALAERALTLKPD
jgi:protein O-mannosyl-transferase